MLSLNQSTALSAAFLLMTTLLAIPVTAGCLAKDPAVRRDARRLLTEIVRLLRWRD